MCVCPCMCMQRCVCVCSYVCRLAGLIMPFNRLYPYWMQHFQFFFTCYFFLKPHEGDIVCCWFLTFAVATLFSCKNQCWTGAPILNSTCWEKNLPGNMNLHISCSPGTLTETWKLEWKGFFFFLQRTPHICVRLLKLVYRIRQYDECQQVSAITLTYLQFKLAQLSVFFLLSGTPWIVVLQ